MSKHETINELREAIGRAIADLADAETEAEVGAVIAQLTEALAVPVSVALEPLGGDEAK